MLLSQFSARNSGQRVELEAHWNVAGCSIKQLEELDFGVFQGRVRHVVDECNSDALGPCGVAFDRSRRAQALSRGPTGRNPAAVNDQWHDIPLELIGVTISLGFILRPCPAPGPGRQ